MAETGVNLAEKLALVKQYCLLIEPRGVINSGASGGELTAAAHRV
jgi:hypothetical protein